MKIISRFLITVFIIAGLAGCSSLEYQSGSEKGLHPGHPGHERH